MKTTYLKTVPIESWQLPTYYKVSGRDHKIHEINVWRTESLNISEETDETYQNYIDNLKYSNNRQGLPTVEIERKEFDEQYIELTNKLNEISKL